jgi:hypothetical protein
MEKYKVDSTEYGITVYWYLSPGGTDNYTPQSLETRTNYYGDRDGIITFIEDTDMTWSVSSGAISVQTMSAERQGYRTTDKQVFWTTTSVGQTAEFKFAIKKPFSGLFEVALTKAPDYGIYEFSLDGKPIGEKIDGYNTKVTNTGLYILGNTKLSAGSHTLTVTVTGKNTASSNYYFGLDVIALDPDVGRSDIIEGENMNAARVTTGQVTYQHILYPGDFVGNKRNYQLWWTTTGANSLFEGGILDLDLVIQKTAKIELKGYFLYALDYGIFDVYLDDELIKQIDLYKYSEVIRKTVHLGDFDLTAGQHKLSFKAVGKRGTNYMLGLDCLMLKELGEIANATTEEIPTVTNEPTTTPATGSVSVYFLCLLAIGAVVVMRLKNTHL